MWYGHKDYGIFNIKPYFEDVLIIKDEDLQKIRNTDDDYEITQSDEFNTDENLYYASIVWKNNSQRKINTAIKHIRQQRKKYLQAFDIYKQNVNYGLIQESLEEHELVCKWYTTILALPEQVDKNNYDTIVFPECPVNIQRYL